MKRTMKIPAAAILATAALLLPAAALAQPAEAPEAVYAKYHRAAIAADYAEMARLAPEPQRAALAKVDAADKALAARAIAPVMPRNYLVRSKTVEVKDFRVRLLVSGPGQLRPNAKPEILWGAIRMDVENGAWKVAEARWSTTPPADTLVVRGFGAAPLPAGTLPALPVVPNGPVLAAMNPSTATKTTAPAPAAPQSAAAAAKPAPPAKLPAAATAPRAPTTNAVGSTVERPLGTAKPGCVFKPVMSAEDLALCK